MTDSVTARRVRDTTIKHAISSERDFMSLFDGEMRSFDSISISRRVSAMTKYVYKIAKKRDAAIGRVLVKSSKGGKHDIGIVSWWGTYQGRLSAKFVRLKLDDCSEMPDVDVSRHAIERISERLDTIDTKLIRDELDSAIISIATTRINGRGGWAKTPNGVVRYEYDLSLKNHVIVTYISDEMTSGEKGDWHWIPKSPVSNSEEKILIDIASEDTVYHPIADS